MTSIHLSELAYGFIAGQLAHARALCGRGRPHGELLQAAGARIRSAGICRLGADQPLGSDPHPALHARARQIHPRRAALPGSVRQPVPGLHRDAGGCPGRHRPGHAPPKPLNNLNVYHLTAEERKKLKYRSAPGSLREALNELEGDKVIRAALGEGVYEAFDVPSAPNGTTSACT